MNDILHMLKLMYGEAFTDDELSTLIAAGQNSDLDPLLREVVPMRDPDTGLFYPYSSSKSVVSDLERYFHERGATSWFDQRPINGDQERAALELDDRDVAYEVRLSDTLAQVEYKRNFRELSEAGYPVNALIEDLGPCPRPTVTISIGRVLGSEPVDPKFRMSRADFAIKRGMRRAAELRLPTTGAARVGANLKRLSEIDALPAPEWAGIAEVQLDHEQRAAALGRDDSDGLI